MIEAALIQQCADPGLKLTVAERFIEQAGSPDPLSVTVRSGNRAIPVPQAKTIDEAMALVRQYVGQAVVRVGITQYPAGLRIKDVSEVKPDLVDACANIRMGTALFGKVYRIVTTWYGNAVDEAFEDAVISWQSGYFEGRAVFTAPDPGDVKLAAPKTSDTLPGHTDNSNSELSDAQSVDARKAGIRIDLSGVGISKP